MNPIRTYQSINLDASAVLKVCYYAIGVLGEIGEVMSNVESLGRQAAHQSIQQIRTVRLIVRGAARALYCCAEWSTPQRATVVPATLMQRERRNPKHYRCVGQTEAPEDPRRIRTDLDAGAHIAQRACLFVHMYIEART
jgi:hypothetical protein